RARRAFAGEGLSVAGDDVVGEVGVARVGVTASEEPGEEVLDPLDVEIDSALQTVFAGDIRDVVNELELPLGRFAWAEIVAPDGEGGLAAVADDRFRGVAVGQARLAVTRYLSAEFVKQAR